ncbi:hypothetical protein I6N95_21825 [Vagococcus sp. BWB3-3]|uniref:O-antigen ligase domain-containing protein n=1 Tax=Vagococcus allomyrinae TaxID=2794353 RepID=A0A940PHI5_9ENTE|nr:hypothetical protein [Vagococcus allomyrinae]MBP1043671.1 hypothetical protein [Vagococcus allomyrinae]
MIDKVLKFFHVNTQSIVLSLLVVGLFLPTSVGQWMRNEIFYFVILGAFLLLLFLIQKKVDKVQLGVAVLLNGLLLFYTASAKNIENPPEMYRYYAILFLMMTLIFCLDLDIKNSRLDYSRWALNGISVIFILWSLSAILHIELFTNFIIGPYQAFYDGLVQTMLSEGKPINVFGTHSLAGFYLFIFATLHMLTFYVTRKYFNAVAASLFLIFLVATKSTTSYVYFIIGSGLFLLMLYLVNKKTFIIGLVVAAVLGVILSVKFDLFSVLKSNLFDKASNNGMGIRFREGGTIAVQIDRVMANPFKGTGYRSIWETYYIDCGFTHFAQRLSLPGMILIYLSFFRFLKKHLNWLLASFLFTMFLLFEIGFANFFYFRTLFILPFIVFYISQLIAYNKEVKLEV